MAETPDNTVPGPEEDAPSTPPNDAPVAGSDFLSEFDEVVHLNGQWIYVPEIHRWVYLTELPGDEADAFIERVQNARDKETGDFRVRGLRVELVARCWVDPETRKRVFGLQNQKKLGQLPNAVLDRLFRRCQDINGIDREAIDKGKGNSGGAAGSGTG